MKSEAFAELCQNAAFYVWPSPIGIPIARGGVTPNGVFWIATVEEDGFHIIPTANLTAVEKSGSITWNEEDGHPAIAIVDLSLCEELNPAETRAQIEVTRAELFTGYGSDWLKVQIEGAKRAPAEALIYTRPADPTAGAGAAPVKK